VINHENEDPRPSQQDDRLMRPLSNHRAEVPRSLEDQIVEVVGGLREELHERHDHTQQQLDAIKAMIATLINVQSRHVIDASHSNSSDLRSGSGSG
jgi:hypothetical protein